MRSEIAKEIAEIEGCKEKSGKETVERKEVEKW
jgi:hypothetical protein